MRAIFTAAALTAVFLGACEREPDETTAAPDAATADAAETAGASDTQAEAERDATAEGGATQAHTEPRRTPESALRTFLGATLTLDRAAMEAVILPHPRAEVLWSDGPASPEAQAEGKQFMQTLELTRLEPGDVVTLGDGRQVTVSEDLVGPGRVLLQARSGEQVLPTPFQILHAEDGWRVDVGPLVAARLAAERVRDEQAPESDKAQPATPEEGGG